MNLVARKWKLAMVTAITLITAGSAAAEPVPMKTLFQFTGDATAEALAATNDSALRSNGESIPAIDEEVVADGAPYSTLIR